MMFKTKLKKYIVCLLISFNFFVVAFAQKLSLNEFLSLKDLSLKSIDSLMQKRNFTRFDTSANNITFRFYGYSTLNEVRYLQLGINIDNVFTEIQYQTSIKKEAFQMQQQLVNKKFIKSVGTSSKISFIKNNLSILFSEEPVSELKVLLYTFLLNDEKEKKNTNIFKQG